MGGTFSCRTSLVSERVYFLTDIDQNEQTEIDLLSPFTIYVKINQSILI